LDLLGGNFGTGNARPTGGSILVVWAVQAVTGMHYKGKSENIDSIVQGKRAYTKNKELSQFTQFEQLVNQVCCNIVLYGVVGGRW